MKLATTVGDWKLYEDFQPIENRKINSEKELVEWMRELYVKHEMYYSGADYTLRVIFSARELVLEKSEDAYE